MPSNPASSSSALGGLASGVILSSWDYLGVGTLGVALLELVLEGGGAAELGGAHGGEVGGVAEEDGPGVLLPVVERDGAVGGVGGEVGGGVAEVEAHRERPFAVDGVEGDCGSEVTDPVTGCVPIRVHRGSYIADSVFEGRVGKGLISKSDCKVIN